MSQASYAMYRFWRFQLITTFMVYALALVALLVLDINGNRNVPPIDFVLFLLAALLWNSYWFLFRLSYRLELDGTTVRWFGILRSGSFDVHQLQQIRPRRFSGPVAVLEVADQPNVLIYVRKGFRDLTEALAAAVPGLPIRLSRFTRFGERLPGRHGFRRS